MEGRLDDLEARLDASNERMEESNKRLETKIDESTQRMEAMFQQLLSGRTSHADSTPPACSDVPVAAALVSMQVTPTPAPITETTRPPSPNHGASGVSNRDGPEEADMGAAEEAEGGGSEEGQAALGRTAAPTAAGEVEGDDPYATGEETQASEAQTEQVK
jgi:hypothetical protein